MGQCRCCGKLLNIEVLLTYKNMPRGAQSFVEKGDIDKEKGSDIVLKQCSGCGLVQAIGDPVPYYKDVIRATGVSKQMADFRCKQYSKWINDFGLARKKIIEIGAGRGEYMRLMQESGGTVYGIEHNSQSVKDALDDGFSVYSQFIESEDTVIPGAPYDAFYSMNFLEHIPEPRTWLEAISNNLTDEAVGLIEVPNFDMMVESSMYSEFIQDHLSYFTKETLALLLNISGFEVLSCEPIWYNYILSARVRKKKLLNIDGFIKKEADVKSNVLDCIKTLKKDDKKIATWGAGHQALANLALLEMEDYIEFVIDSASFKQNKYTPVTHLPIVAPEVLSKADIQVVIIMAAGFSEEIWKILENEYPDIEKYILSEKGIVTI